MVLPVVDQGLDLDQPCNAIFGESEFAQAQLSQQSPRTPCRCGTNFDYGGGIPQETGFQVLDFVLGNATTGPSRAFVFLRPFGPSVHVEVLGRLACVRRAGFAEAGTMTSSLQTAVVMSGATTIAEEGPGPTTIAKDDDAC